MNRYVFLLIAILSVGLSGPACFDESDACKAYCEKAAECLDCGGNISLEQCQTQCEELDLSQQKALSNCAKDCANVLACRDITGFDPPVPCVY